MKNVSNIEKQLFSEGGKKRERWMKGVRGRYLFSVQACWSLMTSSSSLSYKKRKQSYKNQFEIIRYPLDQPVKLHVAIDSARAL